MKRSMLAALAAMLTLSACGEAEAPVRDEAATDQSAAEQEFDEQLSEEEADAALDALEAEEAAQE